MEEQQLQTILSFLKTQKLCVIATIHASDSELTPQAALVGFAEADDLCLYFQTADHTRKAHNLSENQNVAIVIGTQLDAATTVQYEGTLSIVTDAEQAHGRQLLIDKESPSVRFLDKPGTIMYKITPTWVRYSRYAAGPPEVFEAKL